MGTAMIIRQAAFEPFKENERHLKGALHCHSTRSDGDSPAEEVVTRYHRDGFDFIALTDHFVYNRESPVPELPITVIPAAEGGCGIDGVEKGFRTYHTVLLGKNDSSNGFAQGESIPSGQDLSPSGKVTCAEDYQHYLDMIHEKGNITFYCHPEWSSTPTRYFENMKGNFAVEIRNTDCVHSCDMDKNCPCWDELLGQGQRIYGVAVDDIHWLNMPDRSWVTVRAENTVSSIIDALAAGAFYSSYGPSVYDFYVEDGTAHVVCDPSLKVEFIADRHPTEIVSNTNGLTHASYELGGEYSYIRACVVDANGRRAWTNPIFLD